MSYLTEHSCVKYWHASVCSNTNYMDRCISLHRSHFLRLSAMQPLVYGTDMYKGVADLCHPNKIDELSFQSSPWLTCCLQAWHRSLPDVAFLSFFHFLCHLGSLLLTHSSFLLRICIMHSGSTLSRRWMKLKVPPCQDGEYDFKPSDRRHF